MRTAAELRRAARATGYFDDYVGDGASVPWYIPPFPANLYLWTYKQYLDYRWPQTFVLHDWLYTPYGQLINVTREEADHVLLEEIGRDSPIDGQIVYRACRIGGAPYFGVSQTGYRVPDVPLSDLPQPAQYSRSSSVALKVIMIFEAVTGGGPTTGQRQRFAGWTESLYFPSNNVADLRTAMETSIVAGQPMLQSRAFLLPPSCSIQGYRYHEVGSAGRAQLRQIEYPGAYASTTSDIPQMAALCTGLNSASGKTRRWTIRGLPDELVENGELVSWFEGTPNWGQYKNALRAFAFRVSALTTLTGNNIIVDATGLCTLMGAVPFTNGTLLQFRGGRDPQGRPVSYDGTIVALGPGPTQMTLNNWANQIGVAVSQGTFTAKQDGFVTFDQDTITAVKSVSRKVGRPFDLFRGRRPNAV